MQLSRLNAFGLKCRELRLKADYRLVEHADVLGVEPALITEYETGRLKPPESYVRQTAFWLRVEPRDLEALLKRRAASGHRAGLSPDEIRSLRASNKVMEQLPTLSAKILRLDEHRR
jgi:transcriptional regulator with XRE-family HTH domain